MKGHMLLANAEPAALGAAVSQPPSHRGAHSPRTPSRGSFVPSRSSALLQSRFPAPRSPVRTCAGVASGLATLYSAAAPATCGEAIEVPLIVL